MVHELTKLIFNPSDLCPNLKQADEIITTYLKERATWLKNVTYPIPRDGNISYVSPKDIDTAFGLKDKTLEEKINERLERNNPLYQVRDIAQIAREHFKLMNPPLGELED